jgi:hypothetical protein
MAKMSVGIVMVLSSFRKRDRLRRGKQAAIAFYTWALFFRWQVAFLAIGVRDAMARRRVVM